MFLIQDTKLFLSSDICVHLVSLRQAKPLPVVYSEDHCSERHSPQGKFSYCKAPSVAGFLAGFAAVSACLPLYRLRVICLFIVFVC